MSVERWKKAFVGIVAVLVLFALVLTSVRIMFSTWYLEWEYHLPDFPVDRYGFTTADRLKWAGISLEYLLNTEGIEFLANQRFEDGTPIYNERELQHMLDVKKVTQVVFVTWYLSLGGLLALGVWAWRGGFQREYRRGLNLGGWLTVILLVTLLGLILLAFRVFFVAFHQVFFDAGTWTFLWSDTLIRLFPEKFWQDIFIWVGGIALAGGLALGIGLRRAR